MALRPEEIRALIGRHRVRDMAFDVLGLIVMLVLLFLLGALFVTLVVDGWERLGSDFFQGYPSRRAASAGILPAWIGSLLVMLVTAAAAVPVGVAAGVWLEEYAPKNWFTEIVEINVNNLAGVPSIIYGLLGLGLLVHGLHLGQSIAAAGLTLAMMILPVVAAVSREVFRQVRPLEARDLDRGGPGRS